MIDPVIQLLISLGFSLLFVVSGIHKLSNRLRFQEIVDAYQIVPSGWGPFVVVKIGIVELTLGAAWLIGNSVLIPLFSAVLLNIYIIAISINLFRGRTYIDCGCGFSGFTGAQENNDGIQQLSFSLVGRNFSLVGLLLISVLPISNREIGVVDYLSIMLGLLSAFFIYAATNQLLSNHNAIGAWRNVSG